MYVMMPSCVPATGIDDNGCTLTAQDMAPYLNNSRILGLGEVMDSISVVQGDKGMHDKLELFEGRIRDGHAPVSGGRGPSGLRHGGNCNRP